MLDSLQNIHPTSKTTRSTEDITGLVLFSKLQKNNSAEEIGSSKPLMLLVKYCSPVILNLDDCFT